MHKYMYNQHFSFNGPLSFFFFFNDPVTMHHGIALSVKDTCDAVQKFLSRYLRKQHEYAAYFAEHAVQEDISRVTVSVTIVYVGRIKVSKSV